MLGLQLNEVNLSPFIIGAGSRDFFFKKHYPMAKGDGFGMKDCLGIEAGPPS